MKLSVTTYSFKNYILQTKCDYFEICDKTKEMGFDGIEFIDLDNKQFAITTDPLKTAKEIREYCAKIGLEVVSYTIGANFLAEDIESEVERICRAVDVARELGAPVMRHDVCYSLPEDKLFNWQDALKVMAPYIRRVAEYAESKGVRTCTENHGYIFQAPERVEALIKAVGSKNYGWLVDMGNFLCADADPAKSVHIASRYAFHAHAKDFLFKSGEEGNPGGFFATNAGNFLRGTIIGHGIVPVKRCVEILKKAGYDSYVSVEFEGMEDCLPAILAGKNYLASLI